MSEVSKMSTFIDEVMKGNFKGKAKIKVRFIIKCMLNRTQKKKKTKGFEVIFVQIVVCALYVCCVIEIKKLPFYKCK